MMEYWLWILFVYVIGSVVGFIFGRKAGISIGSVLTFDLFVRLGYVKSSINADGEIQIEQICEGREPH